MYRHILVPIDDSQLSIDMVQQAVALARSLSAKVTFFHAQADYGASSAGALERVMAPGAFNEQMEGEARALLAKAEVVARTAGVPHDALATISDRPHEAILEAAEARNCDLIFMASHGRRGIQGLVLGSQTQKVLQRTTIPVLVSTVESNVAGAACDAPLAIIRDEHRSLAAVIHGLEFLVREARDSAARRRRFHCCARSRVTCAYFPRRCTIRRKTPICFRSLSARTDECNATLAELSAARRRAQARRRARDKHRGLRGGPAARPSASPTRSQRFATTQMEHMGIETKVIIPAARKYLTEEDWAEIGTASARTAIRVLPWTRTKNTAISSRESSISRPRVSSAAHAGRDPSNFHSSHKGSINEALNPSFHWRPRIPPAGPGRGDCDALCRSARAAFEIDTGNPDVQMRWDNTVRYNLGVRAQSQDSNIIGSPNYDDGDRNFSNGSLVTNRLDLLSGVRLHLQAEHGLSGERRAGTTTRTAASTITLPRRPTRW